MRSLHLAIWLWLKFYVMLEYRTDIVDCANDCQCLSKHVVICSGRDLNNIPRMPHGTQVVVINGTNLSHIRENGLVNLTDHFIKKIEFKNNLISIGSTHKQYLHHRLILNICLTNNYLSNDETIFWKMFSPLVKLKKLILSSASLSILPRYVFTNLNNLRELSLAANKIRSWGDGTVIFQNMTSLKKIDLSNNLIKTVNKTSFPSNLLHSFEGIDLSNNPFTCDCDLLWFSDFLKSTPTIRFVESKKKCPPWNPLFTMAIFYGEYNLVEKKGYISLPEADDYPYHACVLYCDSDRSWVHETFLGRMEQEEGVKLCIHHRDFDVGESITENIDKYLERSWKVVIIISNEFAKSEWCQWEVDVVQERRRRHGRDVVLLIMLESIDYKHMTRRLRTLLDSTSPIMYQRGLGEVLFWKAVTKLLRKPLGDPLTSLL
ncbi:toll-like receptor 4 [Mytilus edulis]|uniref:toll-like receptor 4 n=1 Tax=Mytilus edulis TaxID=6550 RepID=UPI0039EECC0E